MSAEPSVDSRASEPEGPDKPVPDVTPAEPNSPTVPDVPPGPDIPDVPPLDPEPAPDTEKPDDPGPFVDAEIVDFPPAPSVVRAPTVEEVTGYTEGGVPTFDSVRDKIEKRLGAAMGAEELARETEPARTLEEEFEDRKKAAAAKLAEIRRSMDS